MGHAILSTVVRTSLPRTWTLFTTPERLPEWIPGLRVATSPDRDELFEGVLPCTLVHDDGRTVRFAVSSVVGERRLELRWTRDDGAWGTMNVVFEPSLAGTIVHVEHFWVLPWTRRPNLQLATVQDPSPDEFETTRRLPAVAAARLVEPGDTQDQALEQRFRLHLASFRAFAEDAARLRPDLEAA